MQQDLNKGYHDSGSVEVIVVSTFLDVYSEKGHWCVLNLGKE